MDALQRLVSHIEHRDLIVTDIIRISRKYPTLKIDGLHKLVENIKNKIENSYSEVRPLVEERWPAPLKKKLVWSGNASLISFSIECKQLVIRKRSRILERL